MTRTISIILVFGALVALFGLMAVTLLRADYHDEKLWVEVSFTNLTRGQVLSPVFIARHDGNSDPLYSLGQPASEALAKMAEDADATDLLAAWDPETNGNVSESMLLTLDDGPIPPGKTVNTHFEIEDGNTLMSFASMLVSTNDAFIGASGLDVSRTRTVTLTAYDAGSEANSESCEFIPGPPCGNHAEDTAESEGFVYVHNGIHGGEGSGLTPATHDWRDPVARLTIKTWRLDQ